VYKSEKRKQRESPYSETEIWDRDEVLCIVKYEKYRRNKAALTLLWDLDARNNEVTLSIKCRSCYTCHCELLSEQPSPRKTTKTGKAKKGY